MVEVRAIRPTPDLSKLPPLNTTGVELDAIDALSLRTATEIDTPPRTYITSFAVSAGDSTMSTSTV